MKKDNKKKTKAKTNKKNVKPKIANTRKTTTKNTNSKKVSAKKTNSVKKTSSKKNKNKTNKKIIKVTKDEYIVTCLAFSLSIGLGFIPYIRYFAFLIPLFLYFKYQKSKFCKIWIMQSLVLSLLLTAIYILFDIPSIIFKPRCILTNNDINCYGTFIVWKIFDLLLLFINMLSSIIAIICILKINEKKEYKLPILYKLGQKAEKLLIKNLEKFKNIKKK